MTKAISILRGKSAEPTPSIASIGTFDGMHNGHRAVLGTLGDLAARLERRAVAITFHPRPELVLFPERALPDLVSLDDRVEAIRAAGAEDVIVIHFTPVFAQIPAEQFIDWLRDECGVEGLCVGEDFRFGPRAAYDVPKIRALGMPVHAVSLVPGRRSQLKASSTHIREAMAGGLELPLAMLYA